jgi:hypothetical protein
LTVAVAGALALLLGAVVFGTWYLGRCQTSWSELIGAAARQDSVTILTYWLVPVGTTERALRRRFGPPTLELDADSARYQEYVDRRRQAHYTVPASAPTDKVLIYEGATDHMLVVGYYFLDESGRVAELFVGET